jgi:hypothetical protein
MLALCSKTWPWSALSKEQTNVSIELCLILTPVSADDLPLIRPQRSTEVDCIKFEGRWARNGCRSLTQVQVQDLEGASKAAEIHFLLQQSQNPFRIDLAGGWDPFSLNNIKGIQFKSVIGGNEVVEDDGSCAVPALDRPPRSRGSMYSADFMPSKNGMIDEQHHYRSNNSYQEAVNI